MTATPILAVDALSVEFRTRKGTVRALEDVSLSLEKGEVLGIVGESGSGKSVTAFTVIGLLDKAGRAVGGSAEFDGIPLTGARESSLRSLRGREISMIFQNPRAALNPIRPVGKQIEDVLLRHAQASRQDVKAKAIEMLDRVKIVDPEHRYGSYPFELSGGMCQRVMIAIALSCDPRLLIADEPTTGLDVTTQKATMDLIRDLTRERQMSVVLITHDLGMAAAYCDRIMVMQQGRVVESAPVADLFARPTHPYTKKLIAASPGPDSELSDLTAVPDELDVAPTRTATHPVTPAPSVNETLLEVYGLVKEFPKRGSNDVFRAVDNISFTLHRGESLGLVGESGCGKSTTSTIITRLMDPTSGDVFFDGENLTTFPAAKFARLPQRTKIQMVFQDPTDSLNPRYSAKDSIAEPLRRLKGLRDGKAITAKVDELADMVGLPRKLLTRFPHQLSGGQKARVGIARAIAVDPLMLVLDEPTSALDVSVQAVVLQLLDRLKRDLGMSYIFVSHDLNVVRLLCERVIVMNKGQIVESGTADAVLKNPVDPYTRTLINAIPHFEPEKIQRAPHE
ncbi:ABC transporter ATP-binding protein [Magnetospira sp. QH-2]|uniref:dipeptide ABC transporter ATP-binding protein n=1 Tax=Magnetospira sp. (strain QH-2) TaxID=1288970 RepID=UPI0003E80EB8|nr:ABC transporter ATP-binding protein [Magnetospira sp. QH-2]CCQ72537.1 putative dipeptide/oligopeptide/nickel ABC transporter, ATP binding subunit [Magnetospira sp. QH-2]